MVRIVKIEEAANKKYKWTATFDDGTHTSFGQAGASDFTQHGNEIRKKAYLSRHEKDLKTNDPRRAGYLSYYVLWNKPTVEESVRDFNRRFGGWKPKE